MMQFLCSENIKNSDTSSIKNAYQQNASNPSCLVHPRQKQPLKLAIILAAHEFESLRLHYRKKGACRLASPISFGKDVLDKRDWASIGKCGRVCASRDKLNG